MQVCAREASTRDADDEDLQMRCLKRARTGMESVSQYADAQASAVAAQGCARAAVWEGTARGMGEAVQGACAAQAADAAAFTLEWADLSGRTGAELAALDTRASAAAAMAAEQGGALAMSCGEVRTEP